MQRFLFLMALSTVLGAGLPGCGGSGANSVVSESADEKAKADYERELKASQDAMNRDMGKK